MPPQNGELVELATGDLGPADQGTLHWRDGSEITEEEIRTILAVRIYHFRLIREKAKDKTPQRRALRTLRSFLRPEQRRQLRQNRYFIVVGPSGNGYRLWPRTGLTERVAKHGKNWFLKASYCLHDSLEDETQIMPPADLTLAHLLLISADESEFLETANSRAVESQMWSGAWRRQLRQARAEQEAMTPPEDR